MDHRFTKRQMMVGCGLLLSTASARAALPTTCCGQQANEPVEFSWPMHSAFVEEAGGVRISGEGHVGFVAAARGIAYSVSPGQIFIYHAERLLTVYEWNGAAEVNAFDWIPNLKTIGRFADKHSPGDLLFKIIKNGRLVSPVSILPT